MIPVKVITMDFEHPDPMTPIRPLVRRDLNDWNAYIPIEDTDMYTGTTRHPVGELVLVYDGPRQQWVAVDFPGASVKPSEKPVYTFTLTHEGGVDDRYVFTSDKPFPDPMPMFFEFIGTFNLPGGPKPSVPSEVLLTDGETTFEMLIFNSSKKYTPDSLPEDVCWITMIIPAKQIVPTLPLNFTVIFAPDVGPGIDGYAQWVGPVISGDDSGLKNPIDGWWNKDTSSEEAYLRVEDSNNVVPAIPPHGYTMKVNIPIFG